MNATTYSYKNLQIIFTFNIAFFLSHFFIPFLDFICFNSNTSSESRQSSTSLICNSFWRIDTLFASTWLLRDCIHTIKDILYFPLRRTNLALPYVAVFRLICSIISVVSSTLDICSNRLMIRSVSNPTETAPYKEESVIRYSWMNWGRESGSAIAVRKSVAYL